LGVCQVDCFFTRLRKHNYEFHPFKISLIISLAFLYPFTQKGLKFLEITTPKVCKIVLAFSAAPVHFLGLFDNGVKILTDENLFVLEHFAVDDAYID
jgi:hypothetical protein